ncbi:AIPR family protein [Pseudomonas sp.]|uniref:AIPR family protein n=1 Tax=Pseudomonas sp. TaxID=306 RepID=UPI002C55F5AA|nr:AIPR family protein [Pseudomonas sp.]HUE92622.1 AIPR family protein [Pseudomonas sp.]
MIKETLTSIKELASRAKISHHKAFTAWYAINLHDLDEDEALESAAMDGGNDNGLDLIFADEASRTIYILQGHCGENHSKITSKDKWDGLVAAVPFFEDTSTLRANGKADLADHIDTIKKDYEGYNIAFGLISLGLFNEKIEKAIQPTKKSYSAKNYHFFYQHQEKILTEYKNLIDSETGIASDTITFVGNYIQDEGKYGRAWIGSVSAAELTRLYDEYQNKLFAGNVRLFLGSRKGGINEQIIKTAKDNPGLFWALNNGVSIITDSAIPDGEIENKLHLKRFSIVNGCQTTNSLAQAKAGDKAKVLVRVIAAKETVKNDVVRFNNSQNAIKIWTVRAVDSTQEKLRKSFQEIQIDYAPKQSGSRKKKSGEIIELDRAAQFLAAQDSSLLIQAINNKGELFDQPYSKIFYPNIEAKTILLAWKLGLACDKARIEQLSDMSDDDESAGLFAVAATFWIIFIAHNIISKHSDLSSTHITLQKINTTPIDNFIAKISEQAVDIFYTLAIDTYGDGEEFGSHKSTLRSIKFLQKIEKKTDFKVRNLKKVQKLENICKGIS